MSRSNSLEEVLSRFKLAGLEPLFSEYVNRRTPVRVKCSKGHIRDLSLSSVEAALRNGRSSCPGCSKTPKLTEEEIFALIRTEGHEPLSPYIRSNLSMRFRCPNGHEYQTSLTNFTRGGRCRTCHLESVKKKAVTRHSYYAPPEGCSPADHLVFYEGLQRTGVYSIFCSANGKIYIGSTSRSNTRKASERGFWGRWYQHLRLLELGKHPNRYLQHAWAKYGAPSFHFKVIESVEPELCIEREQYWMDYYQSYDPTKGFNQRAKAESLRGHKLTDEHRAKLSKALKGRKMTDEHKQKIAMKLKGREFSEEHRDAIRQSRIGAINSEESNEKRSKALKGRKCTDEHIAKRVASRKRNAAAAS